MGMDEDILKDFLAESKENLERLDQEFVELEQEPDNAELIKSIFRTIHTIKGTSGFFGFTTLEGIAHFAEDILSKLRDGVAEVNEEITTVLLQSVDYIKAILASLEQTGKEPDDVVYLDFIVDLRNFAEKVANGSVGAANDTAPAEAPESNAGGENASKAEPVQETSEEKAADQPEDTKQEDNKEPETTGKAEEQKTAPKAPPAPKPKKRAPTTPAPTTHLTETHVRVDVHLLDKLMNLAGELVLSRNRMAQIATQLDDADLLTANQRMSLVVTELQEQIMKTRMQPVGNVFNKFPRIVRDLAKSAQKQIQLQIKGAETELDRSIIEVIKDPLTHMVRNSIDHGVEPPDIRVQKGKPQVGTLIMKAYHEGGQVIIEIQDDGAGMDPEKLREKAVEKGIISPDQATSLSDREALMLIFQPGFSTAEKVTNISGRGVGMDVVKTNIEKLGGTVELKSEVNVGTTVRIKIPLTLAIIPALIVRAAGQRYAIPQVNLVELVCLSPEAQKKDVQVIGNSEFYRLRGQILPLVRLKKILGAGMELASEQDEEDNKASMNIVVLNSGDRQFGLVVDAINDSEEIVVKPLGKHLKHISCYAGTTLMGDGRVALILDIVGIASTLNLRAEDSLHETKMVAESRTAEEERQFLLLFSVDPSECFALPLALVNRLDKIPASRIEHVGSREVVQYRGKSMPVIRLENYLPISPLSEQEEYHLIVFNFNNKDVAFLVSQIEDSVDIVIDVEEETFRQEGILGSAIIKDKTTLFIDIYQILQMYDPDFLRQEQDGSPINARILMAEDSAFYRNLLHSYISAEGYEIITAEDGQQAWELLQTEEVDLVMTDIEMPRMNGLKLAQKIRGNAKFEKLPILAVTSLSGEEDKNKAMEAGVDEYLPKLDRDQVLTAVKNLLKSREIKEAA